MVQSKPRFLTFDEYLSYDDGTDKLYELFNGELIEVPPESGRNTTIAGFLFLYFSGLVDFRRVRGHGLELEVRGEPRNRYPDLTIIREEHVQQLARRNTIRLEMAPPLLNTRHSIAPKKKQDMIAQLLESPVSFDDFIEWLPESSENRYELHRERIVEMAKPRGKHSDVAGYAAKKVNYAIDAAELPWFIPKECIVRSLDEKSGYEPDIIVLDRTTIIDEPRWESGSILTLGKSIKLIVEVVSSNWQDDYMHKLADYEALGIQEYWIADYAALGGRRFIGNPKQPTFSVYSLVDEEYELALFRGSDHILSPTFPELGLTVDQVFAAGQPI